MVEDQNVYVHCSFMVVSIEQLQLSVKREMK
jgi:hypothetical protein